MKRPTDWGPAKRATVGSTPFKTPREKQLRKGETSEQILLEVNEAGKVHGLKRNRSIAKFLVYLRQMTSGGFFSSHMEVRVGGAAVQDEHGDRWNNAAHAVPRQVFIDKTGKVVVPVEHERVGSTRVAVSSRIRAVNNC